VLVLALSSNIISYSKPVDALDLGQPGWFEAEVPFEVDEAQPGRIVVRDPSAAFDGDVYLIRAEVELQP
jgi:hypothetical protein